MTLATSGYISLADNPSSRAYPDNRVVNIELNKSANATISHPSSETRNLTGVGSGALRLPDDYWNKTATFYFNLSAGANVDFRTQAINAGWDQTLFLVGTLPSGVVITSSSPGTAGLTISGSFPRGVKFINQGVVYGAGGAGGTGSNGSSAGSNGGNAGTALYVSVSCQVDNALGELRGGGGGGGGGGGYYDAKYGPTYFGGGGGGGSGNSGGSGGSGGGGGATVGGNGDSSAVGAGGQGSVSGYLGGNGGSQGSTGSAGQNSGNRAAGSGGAAGSSTQGAASYISWVGAGYGVRVGPVN